MKLINLDQLVSQANELTPLPATVVQLAALVSRNDYDVAEVVALAALDQSITLRLLRAANSAVSASETPVTTVGDAVLRIGAAQVLGLTVAAKVATLFRARVPAYGLGEDELWRHSVAAAVAAQASGAYCRAPIPPEAFTAALLHDVGKLVMARFITPSILDLIDRGHQEGGLDRLQAEREILEVHHGELGGIIAQHWHLPDSIVQGIIHHHTPEQSREDLAGVTALANLVAKAIELGTPGPPPPAGLMATITDRLGMATGDFEALCATARTQYSKLSARYT